MAAQSNLKSQRTRRQPVGWPCTTTQEGSLHRMVDVTNVNLPTRYSPVSWHMWVWLRRRLKPGSLGPFNSRATTIHPSGVLCIRAMMREAMARVRGGGGGGGRDHRLSYCPTSDTSNTASSFCCFHSRLEWQVTTNNGEKKEEHLMSCAPRGPSPVPVPRLSSFQSTSIGFYPAICLCDATAAAIGTASAQRLALLRINPSHLSTSPVLSFPRVPPVRWLLLRPPSSKIG